MAYEPFIPNLKPNTLHYVSVFLKVGNCAQSLYLYDIMIKYCE